MYNSDTIDLEDSYMAEGGTKGYYPSINDSIKENPNDKSVMDL